MPEPPQWLLEQVGATAIERMAVGTGASASEVVVVAASEWTGQFAERGFAATRSLATAEREVSRRGATAMSTRPAAAVEMEGSRCRTKLLSWMSTLCEEAPCRAFTSVNILPHRSLKSTRSTTTHPAMMLIPVNQSAASLSRWLKKSTGQPAAVGQEMISCLPRVVSERP